MGVPRYAGVVGEELITDVEKQKSWCWRHCKWLLLITPITLTKLVTLNPNSNQRAPGTLPASFPLVGCLPQKHWPERLLSEKVRTLWHYEWGRGALPMIDRGDIRQAIDRYGNIWASCRALVMVSSSIRLTAWLQNSKKRAERSERLMYEQVTAIISFLIYLHHRLPVMGC